MKASIIIPVFNRLDLTIACVEGVRKYTDGDYEIVMVDDGSTEEIFVEMFGKVDRLFQFAENHGYATACNKGASLATGDIFVFLNSDTEVSAGWLPALLEPLKDETVGMSGAWLLYPNGRTQHAGISFRMKNGELEAWNIQDGSLPSREVEGVTGACCAVRRDVFGRVGGFDEGFDNGYDDVDLCLQVRAAGYHIAYVREAVVIHHESASGPERWRSVKANVARLQQKWLGHPVVADVA